ncbi:hypothetical protein K7432_009236 [Basidiobolus ranarum]|uniref:Uncharacterized protein n=1 Tax=Basidiobolus ranarum TaxID=34480 RepID=A0ABR2VXE1_9FUNG
MVELEAMTDGIQKECTKSLESRIYDLVDLNQMILIGPEIETADILTRIRIDVNFMVISDENLSIGMATSIIYIHVIPLLQKDVARVLSLPDIQKDTRL